MLLQVELFILLSTAALMQYSYGYSSLANNTNQHFAVNNSSKFVTLDQISAFVVMDLIGRVDEGSYHVNLKLGQHQQEYSLMIDTGSELTWVNCETSSRYRHPHPAYNPPVLNKVLCDDPLCSLVEHPRQFPCNHPTDECNYQFSYLDHTSTRGKVISEILSFPFTGANHSLLPPSIKIGCGTHQNYPPRAHIGGSVDSDGILGLARISELTIVRQLAKKRITRSMFGHCISRPTDGYFFIGAGQVLPSSITWARMVTLHDENHYSPGRARLLFDSGGPHLSNLKMIFDSGSTVSFLKTSALRVVINLLKEHLAKENAPLRQARQQVYPICWKGSQPIQSVDEVAMYFKTMTLVFQGDKRFELPPYTYLFVQPRHRNSGKGDVCLGIEDATKAGLGQMNLIGDNFFQNKLVVYDLEREMIGWASSNCHNRRRDDRKHRHIDDRKYRRTDLYRHRFSTKIPVLRQHPPTNYTTIRN